MNTLLTISALGILAMLAEFLKFKKLLSVIVFLGIGLSLFFCYDAWNKNESFYNYMIRIDNYSIAFSALILVSSLLWFLMSEKYFQSESSFTDHFAIILFTVAGGLVMTSFSNLAMLFIGIEILSVSLYILAASNKKDPRSNEAGMKYFLMGSFATGFLLFGIALIYGVSGTLNTELLAAYVSANAQALPLLFYAGLILLLFGLFFKISAVPFHFWAPDVYEGSPVYVTAFMATIVKTSAFAAFFRLFYDCFIPIAPDWTNVIMVVSALTMLTGNIIAVYQSSLKRMLAYSGIAHAGYMLMAILTASPDAMRALLLYTTAYSIAGLTAFAFIGAAAGDKKGDVAIDELKGFSKNNQGLAFIMTIALLSMAGIPPVAGFFAKYFLFYNVIQHGFTGLVVIAVISSLIGVYYYLRVVVNMYNSVNGSDKIELGLGQRLFFVITLILTVLLGFLPTILTDLF